MTRYLTTLVLSAVLSTVCVSNSAQAQLGGFKPPRIEPGGVFKPRRPRRPGRYQRKVGSGIIEGAQVGAGIGGEVGGGYGAVVGGVIGGIGGGLKADQEYHGEKVHNFRTKPNLRILNQWHNPVVYDMYVSGRWVRQRIGPRSSRALRGPVDIRFYNGIGQLRSVTMRNGTFTFHAQGNAVEMSW